MGYQMRAPGLMEDGFREFVEVLPLGVKVIEIGSFAGESARILLEKASEIICVDPWGIPLRSGKTFDGFDIVEAEARFDSLVRAFPGRIIKVKAESSLVAPFIANASVNVVYIDGLHDYHSVAEDIKCWGPKVKEGGCIAGHDYAYGAGVIEAVRDTLGGPDVVFVDTTWVVGVGCRLVFDESDYLVHNKDVAEAVKRGLCSSGLAHYRMHGCCERRKVRYGWEKRV